VIDKTAVTDEELAADDRLAELESRVAELEARLAEAGRRALFHAEHQSGGATAAKALDAVGRALLFDTEMAD
jgi:hypothetical protein